MGGRHWKPRHCQRFPDPKNTSGCPCRTIHLKFQSHQQIKFDAIPIIEREWLHKQPPTGKPSRPKFPNEAAQPDAAGLSLSHTPRGLNPVKAKATDANGLPRLGNWSNSCSQISRHKMVKWHYRVIIPRYRSLNCLSFIHLTFPNPYSAVS